MCRRLACLAALAGVVMLAGCSRGEEPSTFAPEDLLGSSVAQLEPTLPPDTAYVVYDLSLPLAGVEATYGDPDAPSNDQWLVVVACGSAEELAVGVISAEDYTEGMRSAARDGKYRDLLLECGTG